MVLFRVPSASSEPDKPSPSQASPQSASHVTDLFARLCPFKTHRIESSSGDPETHPSLSEEGVTSTGKVTIERVDMYLCSGAVDPTKLLRGSRSNLLDKAISLGANALVEEQWTCTIYRRKSRPEGPYRVNVRYSARATHSLRPDPNRPVSLDKAVGIAGLMTILYREGMSGMRHL